MEKNLIEKALDKYQTEKGGPEIRDALEDIKSANILDNYRKKKVIKSLNKINQLSKKNPTLINPLLDFAYKKLMHLESYEVGAFILKKTLKKYKLKIDTEEIKNIGNQSVVNYGDKLLRFYENEFKVQFDLEKIAEQAYGAVSDDCFAGRALDALGYISKKGAEIDKKKLNREILEKVIENEISDGTNGYKNKIQDAKRHLNFLQSIGIELISSGRLKEI